MHESFAAVYDYEVIVKDITGIRAFLKYITYANVIMGMSKDSKNSN